MSVLAGFSTVLESSNEPKLTAGLRDFREDNDTFRQSLASSLAQGERQKTPEQRARGAAEELVSTTLIQPILAETRKASFAAEPFGPTSAEKSFGPLMDAALSREIVRAANFPLVDRLERDMLQRANLAAPTQRAAMKTTGEADADQRFTR